MSAMMCLCSAQCVCVGINHVIFCFVEMVYNSLPSEGVFEFSFNFYGCCALSHEGLSCRELCKHY